MHNDSEVAYQVVEGQVGQIGQIGLRNAEVLEGLRCGVDHLVDELTLNLIGGHGVPPEELVEVVSQGLQDGLGEVDVAALLDDFTVNQLGDLRSRVVLRTVQLVSLTGGGVVVQHSLKTLTNVDRL